MTVPNLLPATPNAVNIAAKTQAPRWKKKEIQIANKKRESEPPRYSIMFSCLGRNASNVEKNF